MAKFCIYEEHGGICTLSDHPCNVGGPCEYLEEFAPVQHGKWVSLVVKREDWKGVLHDFYQPYSCSICQNPNTFMGESAFCPHCGARMTEDIDEQKK